MSTICQNKCNRLEENLHFIYNNSITKLVGNKHAVWLYTRAINLRHDLGYTLYQSDTWQPYL